VIGRTDACDSIRWGARLPAPIINSHDATFQDRYDETSADAAAVLCNVSSVPSSSATGTPVIASISR